VQQRTAHITQQMILNKLYALCAHKWLYSGCVTVKFAFADSPESHYYRTAKVGETVKFPCPTKVPAGVDWIRLDTLESDEEYIYFGNIGLTGVGLDPRFTVLGKNQSYSLVIYNVRVNDSAYYRCADDNGFGRRHFYGLTVEGSVFYHSAVRKRTICYFTFHTVLENWIVIKFSNYKKPVHYQLFLPRDAVHSADLVIVNLYACLSVRLSVFLSVCLSHSWTTLVDCVHMVRLRS